MKTKLESQAIAKNSTDENRNHYIIQTKAQSENLCYFSVVFPQFETRQTPFVLDFAHLHNKHTLKFTHTHRAGIMRKAKQCVSAARVFWQTNGFCVVFPSRQWPGLSLPLSSSQTATSFCRNYKSGGKRANESLRRPPSAKARNRKLETKLFAFGPAGRKNAHAAISRKSRGQDGRWVSF